MVYGYRGLTQVEFEELKNEVKKVSGQRVSVANNHHNGVRISAAKQDGYTWTFENAERILEALDRLGMFTLPIRQEFEVSRKIGNVHSQIFSMVHKAC